MLNFRDFISEAFDSPYSAKMNMNALPDFIDYSANTKAGRLVVMIGSNNIRNDEYQIDFEINKSNTIMTNAGEATRILGTVLKCVEHALPRIVKENGERPKRFLIVTNKSKGQEDKRMNVYLKLVSRYAAKFGYKQTEFRDIGGVLNQITLVDAT